MSVSVSWHNLSACSNKCKGLWWGQCGISEHHTGWNTRHPCGWERHHKQLLASFPGRRVHARCILLAKGEPSCTCAYTVTDTRQRCMAYKASELKLYFLCLRVSKAYILSSEGVHVGSALSSAYLQYSWPLQRSCKCQSAARVQNLSSKWISIGSINSTTHPWCPQLSVYASTWWSTALFL